ncbi:MAG TPA: FAD-linked oxidase C-terminal domain-containing protein [Planctomycetaceae bacterium]|nr:FAD-linked oxidase C-terminal domain-containing protein [Planctomycetaceae bacterium]
MDERRRRLVEDLNDAIEGELRVDRVALAAYSTDASLYEIEPLAVVFPRATRDVEILAAYSADNNIPLIARGAGSGLAGSAIGSGIVIDFSRHMNQVLSISADRVRVQPGVLREQLNNQLREHDRYFAPDPSNSRICTLGGMLGVDAAGAHAVRIGSARDHVFSMECVLSGGQRMELGRESLATRNPTTHATSLDRDSAVILSESPLKDNLQLSAMTSMTRRTHLIQQVTQILRENAELIRELQPPLLRNCCGYLLRGILQGEQLDLSRMLVGSEGTLALFTEATLFTMLLPKHRSAAILMFGSMDSAIQAMQLILPLEPSACDLLDRRLLSLGRGADQRFRDLILPDAEAGLIIEFPGSHEREVRQRLDDAQRLLKDRQIHFQLTRQASTYDEVEMLWALPSRVVSLLASLKGVSRPLPFVEDVAVPPDQLAEFLLAAQRVFQKHEVTATLYSHAASGQLHFRPIIPVPNRGDETAMEAIARDLYRKVWEFGGTITGEHGDGLSRTAFIRTQYGALYRTFQQIKEVFDPQRLMNPDKIISNDPSLTVKHLRRTRPLGKETVAAPSGPLLPVMQLEWTAEQATEAAVRCNGCGICRINVNPLRMCPFSESNGEEEVSPRAKANVVRNSLCSDSMQEILTQEDTTRLLESCFNCKQCQLECPSEVNIPHLLIEARAQHVQAHGLSKTAWLLSRVHNYSRMASRISFLTNQLLNNGLFRRILQRFTGISARRRLPKFTQTPFLETKRVTRDDNSGAPGSTKPTVVYFVDYFANNHDPELAEAFVRILEHNGYRVFIPPAQTVCGMAMFVNGDLTAARALAEQNIRELVEPAREGYPIVCTEPTAALCLSQEYPMMVASDDAEIVAQQTIDAGAFLAGLHRKGQLKQDFAPLPIRVAWHTPCHVNALRRGTPMLELLALIPELTVQTIDKGCTGMAGTFGIAAANFEKSIAIGAELIREMQTIDVIAGVTDCSSCRMQMEQAATIPTIHPIKLLALSYGLMPRLAERLKAKPGGLVMS